MEKLVPREMDLSLEPELVLGKERDQEAVVVRSPAIS